MGLGYFQSAEANRRVVYWLLNAQKAGFGTSMETDGIKEQLDANDTCGRCGCARRDHLPVCSSHPKCKNFSDPKRKKMKKK